LVLLSSRAAEVDSQVDLLVALDRTALAADPAWL
jgi:hypothetical protein